MTANPTPNTDTASRWELIRALGVLADSPAPKVAQSLGLGELDPADHTEVFSFQTPPYASFYLDGGGMLGGEVAGRVAGYWQALGYPIPHEPDHLTALLGLYAALREREETENGDARRVMLGQACRALLTEHLLPWIGVFTDAVRCHGLAPWAEWADLLDQAIAGEAEGTSDAMSRHLQEAPPPIDDCRDLRSLLVPVRTGMVITRADLVRCARQSGLGIRLTGRVPTLKALFDQSPDVVLAWMGAHITQWESCHRNRIPALGAAAFFWAERAAHTRSLLTQAGAAT